MSELGRIEFGDGEVGKVLRRGFWSSKGGIFDGSFVAILLDVNGRGLQLLVCDVLA